jgi:high affinity Mn2+ porin
MKPSSPWPRTPINSRYWLSGQANIIFQGRLPFPLPLPGHQQLPQLGRVQDLPAGHALHRPAAHALHPLQHRPDPRRGERRRPRPQRGAGAGRLHQPGRGAQPHLGSQPYLARYGIHQVIGLTQETTSQEPGPFALAPSVPAAPHRVPHRQDDAARLSSTSTAPAPTATCSS